MFSQLNSRRKQLNSRRKQINSRRIQNNEIVFTKVKTASQMYQDILQKAHQRRQIRIANMNVNIPTYDVIPKIKEEIQNKLKKFLPKNLLIKDINNAAIVNSSIAKMKLIKSAFNDNYTAYKIPLNTIERPSIAILRKLDEIQKPIIEHFEQHKHIKFWMRIDFIVSVNGKVKTSPNGTVIPDQTTLKAVEIYDKNMISTEIQKLGCLFDD